MKSFMIKAAWCITAATGLFFSTTNAQQKYTVKGKIDGLTGDTKVLLFYGSAKDSTMAKDGSFSLEGVIDHPYFASVRLQDATKKIPDMQSFYIAAGLTTIQGKSLREAIIHNPVQDDYLEYKATVKPLEQPALAISSRLFSTDNKDTIAVLNAKKAAIDSEYQQMDIRFVKTHPSSYVSFAMVKSYGVIISDPDTFEKIYNALAPSFKNTPDGRRMAADLKHVRAFAVGRKAANFSQPDVNGKPVSLSSFKGKYVLIDFWASWCAPCRAEFPYLRQAYDQYKDKGFDIFAVSIDDKKDLWVKAMDRNKFPWTEVCDLKGKQNKAAVLYGVSAIPQNYLVGPDGTILAKNLRGNNLPAKLKEIFAF